jgi:hypothetical protein
MEKAPSMTLSIACDSRHCGSGSGTTNRNQEIGLLISWAAKNCAVKIQWGTSEIVHPYRSFFNHRHCETERVCFRVGTTDGLQIRNSEICRRRAGLQPVAH